MEVFTTTSTIVYHMEADRYIPGSVMYTDNYSLKTSNGSGSEIIAGNTTERGYKEDAGSDARFTGIRGFTQISRTRVVVSDSWNYCLRLVNRANGMTSQFAGQCTKYGGYTGGFTFPQSIIRDVKKTRQLIVCESNAKVIRTVDIRNGTLATFVDLDFYVNRVYQLKKSGDLIMPNQNKVLRCDYQSKETSVLIDSVVKGYWDGPFQYSLFDTLKYITILDRGSLLVVDEGSKRIRILDFDLNQTETLLVQDCESNSDAVQHTSCRTIPNITSVLVTKDTLFIGGNSRITSGMSCLLLSYASYANKTCLRCTVVCVAGFQEISKACET